MADDPHAQHLIRKLTVRVQYLEDFVLDVYSRLDDLEERLFPLGDGPAGRGDSLRFLEERRARRTEQAQEAGVPKTVVGSEDVTKPLWEPVRSKWHKTPTVEVRRFDDDDEAG